MLSDGGIVPLLVTTMSAYPDLPGVQDAGCAVLAVLASNDHVKTPILDCRGHIVIANAIKAVRSSFVDPARRCSVASTLCNCTAGKRPLSLAVCPTTAHSLLCVSRRLPCYSVTDCTAPRQRASRSLRRRCHFKPRRLKP